jgi:hypothetical protein
MNPQKKRWMALPGYWLDIYRLSRARFINGHRYLKFVHLRAIARQCGAATFVETGTYLGITADWCSRIFDQVYTIEIEPKLAASATSFLARRSNVRVIQGDAVTELPAIFRENRFDCALVYLDGHFSGGVTGSGPLPEPAVQELRALAEFKPRIGAIVVDDFRSFGHEPGFPRKSELVRAAEDMFGGYDLSVNYDQLALVRGKHDGK